MNHAVNFASNNYQMISWAEILTNCYLNKKSISPFVLSNNGWILIPHSICSSSNLNLVLPSGIMSVPVKLLEFIDYAFLEDCNIKVAKVPEDLIDKNQHSLEIKYLSVCRSVCESALHNVYKILFYTYDHLNHRRSEGKKLTQHDPIKFSISNIICQLHSAESILKLSNNYDALLVLIDYLLGALHILSELGGGRAMLRGNSTELMFHLQQFKSLFLRY